MALTPDRIRTEYGLKINEKLIQWNAVWLKDYVKDGKVLERKGNRYKADTLLTNKTGVVKALTIHNTGGDANAETYTRATYPNCNMGYSRVHYFVDDVEAWQNLKDNEVGWHAGDGNGNGNMTSISIEIIMHGKAIKDNVKSEANGALLAAILLNKYNLTVKDMYPHKQWSGKNCPIYILPHWDKFVSDVQKNLDMIKSGGTTPTPVKPIIPQQTSTFKIDDVVRVKKGGLWTNNKPVPQFVINSKMYVTIVYNDGTVVISTSKRGAITGRIKTSWLEKA